MQKGENYKNEMAAGIRERGIAILQKKKSHIYYMYKDGAQFCMERYKVKQLNLSLTKKKSKKSSNTKVKTFLREGATQF